MQEYRLFFFDGARHVEKAHEFEAENDEAAIKISEGWREGRRVELWHRDQRVMLWDQPPSFGDPLRTLDRRQSFST